MRIPVSLKSESKNDSLRPGAAINSTKTVAVVTRVPRPSAAYNADWAAELRLGSRSQSATFRPSPVEISKTNGSYGARRRTDPCFTPLEIARRPGTRVYDVDSRVSLHAQFAIASEDSYGRVVFRFLGSSLQCCGNHSEWRHYAGCGAPHEFPTVASELVSRNPRAPSASSRRSALAGLFQCWRCAHN